jgi:hypothetical protein
VINQYDWNNLMKQLNEIKDLLRPRPNPDFILSSLQEEKIRNEGHKVIRYVVDTECREIIERATREKVCDEIINAIRPGWFSYDGVINTIKEIRDRQ